MSDRVTRLFARYIAELDEGREPDLPALLDEAGDEREVLGDMLALYLPSRPRAQVPEPVLDEPVTGQEPMLAWPELLPALRERASLTRGDMVAALAAELGYPEAEEQVLEYVRELETGVLPARHVSRRVVEALALVLGVREGVLNWARSVDPPLSASTHTAAETTVDELFTGGDAWDNGV